MKGPSEQDVVGVEEVRHRTADRLYGFFVVGRVVVAPLIAAGALWILANDEAFWRQVAMAVVAASVLSVSAFDLYDYRRRGLRSFATITRNIVLMTLAASFMTFATGALESPFIFVLALIAFASTLFAPRRLAVPLVVALVAVVWLFAVVSVRALVPDLVPTVFGGGARTARDDLLLWTSAVVLSAILVAIVNVGMRLRTHFELLLVEQLDQQKEALSLHAEQLRALTTLSGEIAHELKNPLASVKGLAALVDRELAGRPAEHMAVLRREVDRMQAVLQGFLNFSRPLSPLALREVDLVDLADEVVALHAGVAAERGVGLELRASGGTAVACDERKVKQVLINLVQNALEASPRGALVALEVEGGAVDEVRLRVLDEGPGLPPEIADRVFEAGVTGRAEGSGLGLTVARALARQHGGELAFEALGGRGVAAVFTLPRSPEAARAGRPEERPGEPAAASGGEP